MWRHVTISKHTDGNSWGSNIIPKGEEILFIGLPESPRHGETLSVVICKNLTQKQPKNMIYLSLWTCSAYLIHCQIMHFQEISKFTTYKQPFSFHMPTTLPHYPLRDPLSSLSMGQRSQELEGRWGWSCRSRDNGTLLGGWAPRMEGYVVHLPHGDRIRPLSGVWEPFP